ncbi:uncharacterized protein LOC116352034 [Contarinia nasturtii]|uniref:uncharacterized protein LOC116352034 n=1 Tax=Contarinia nasturtii TaxID=265458 RepID=UPI0012D3734F|nr:uncharacterized protein LOC116352034 [Contarinia nasturtii]
MANIWINIVILSLFCAIADVTCTSETFGETTPNLALKENIIVKGEMLSVKTVVIDWPSKDNFSNTTSEIRGIVHINDKQSGHGPILRFIKGGVRHTFVSMELVSKRGHGIHSTILIYV